MFFLFNDNDMTTADIPHSVTRIPKSRMGRSGGARPMQGVHELSLLLRRLRPVTQCDWRRRATLDRTGTPHQYRRLRCKLSASRPPLHPCQHCQPLHRPRRIPMPAPRRTRLQLRLWPFHRLRCPTCMLMQSQSWVCSPHLYSLARHFFPRIKSASRSSLAYRRRRA